MLWNMIKFHDGESVFSSAAINRLEMSSSSWPFDVHVVTGNFSSRDDLEATVSRAVTSPNVVAVGIDPQHHKTSVHFGSSTHVSRDMWNEIAKAGNSSFKSGDYEAGLNSILLMTSQNVHAQSIQQVSIPSQPQHTDSAVYWWVGGISLFTVLCLVGFWISTRRQQKKHALLMAELENETSKTSFLNSELESFDARLSGKIPPAVTPAVRRTVPSTRVVERVVQAAPVTVVNSGNQGNDLLTGMLIANALNSHETAVHERVVERTSSDDSGSAGSNCSSDDSSSSSSYDSGGGSSDWGGGGGDSGGGGSDW